MVCAIFVISEIYGASISRSHTLHSISVIGPSVWESRILTVSQLDRIPFVAKILPNIKLNESFMIFGAFALGFNIVVR